MSWVNVKITEQPRKQRVIEVPKYDLLKTVTESFPDSVLRERYYPKDWEAVLLFFGTLLVTMMKKW